MWSRWGRQSVKQMDEWGWMGEGCGSHEDGSMERMEQMERELGGLM